MINPPIKSPKQLIRALVYLSNGVVLSTEMSVKWDRLLAILHIEGNPSLDIVKCVMSYAPISSKISLSLFLVI